MTKTATTERTLDWPALMETALTAPGNVGNVYCRFYDYSWMNCMLLLMQGVREPVATYNRWKDIGRQVQKGSKSYMIVRPITITRNKGEDDEASFVKFKPVNCLFTVSQTDGDPLPEVVAPNWELSTALTALEVEQVPFDNTSGNIQGWSLERTFALNPVAVDPTHTTFHELAHIVLGHTTEETRKEYGWHRGLMEFQAEAACYLVLNELELCTEAVASHARGYIQGWLRDEEPTDAQIRQVFSATDKILKAGRGKLS